MSESIRVCQVTAEVAPYAKSGGLGEVCAALGHFLQWAGHDVRLFLPLYGRIDRSEHHLVPVEFARDVRLPGGGHDLPFTLYTSTAPGLGGALYFIDCPPLYGGQQLYAGGRSDAIRFAYLASAALASCQRMAWGPDLFHVHDWHAALVPLYLRTLYGWDDLFAASQTLLTIHNIGYQGTFGVDILEEIGLASSREHLHQEALAAGRIGFLETGVLHAGALTTVSRTHAEEIQTERYGMGLASMLRARADHLVGIVNGIDYRVWDPAHDSLLPHTYTPHDLAGKTLNKKYLLDSMGLPADEEVPVVGMVTRLVAQKGLDLVGQVMPELLTRRSLRLVVLGSGDARYEALFTDLQHAFPSRVAFYRGYSEELAHLIEAGADLFLMPSLYEPCGLNQMYSQRYGTLPVVRRTGGLADTVEPYDGATGRGTGFVFEHATADGLAWALGQALDLWPDRVAWHRMMVAGMQRDFSWESQIEKYVTLYRALAHGRLRV